MGDLGNLGVRVFFVISGFLITQLLIQECRTKGTISLSNFYLRRIFRIFPAFYVYLSAVAVLTGVGLISVRWSDLGYAAVYINNFVERKSWMVGHLWSLAVEEQFYLLWPFTILALGWRKSTLIVIGAVLVAPILRVGCWYLMPGFRELIPKAFPTICDAIAIGCVLACLRDRLSHWSAYLRFTRSWAFLLIPLMILVSNALGWHATRPDYLVGQSVRNIGIAMSLDWCIRYPNSMIGRFLNLRPMVWLGTLSYSFYLWQQAFLNRLSDAVWCSFPLNISLAFAFAALSYFLIERQFLQLRSRLSQGAKQPGKHVIGGLETTPL